MVSHRVRRLVSLSVGGGLGVVRLLVTHEQATEAGCTLIWYILGPRNKTVVRKAVPSFVLGAPGFCRVFFAFSSCFRVW